MARPTLQPDEKRSERHNIRLTLAEHEHIRSQADAAGVDVAEYLRRRALGYTVPAAASRRGIEPALLSELNRIGVNINQIARNLNSDRRERLDVGGVMTELRAVLARLASVDLPEPGDAQGGS